ncbi:MAG: hypothetical protein AAGA25_10015 [Planctomycetota bacterium]
MKFNMNLIGLILLLGGFLISLFTVVSRSFEEGALSQNNADGKKVIQLMHWQLEPGYREAMQNVMDAYNALPHVQEANVEVRQLDITERVYAQVLNVHAVSGTAPDLCERGGADKGAIAQGAGIAKYFDSLGDEGLLPNPYNAPEYLPDGLDPELADALSNGPWRDTLIDGMQASYVFELQDFYAVPTSFVGSVKIFYNENLFAQAKAVLRKAMQQSPQPQWYQDLIWDTSGNQETGYVTDSPELREWVLSDKEPETLGRLLMICEALWQVAEQTGNDQLVPISGSSYSDLMFAERYSVPFTASLAEKMNYDLDNWISGSESWLGWLGKRWSFEDPAHVAYFDCLREICKQFPPGFLGLDREQARRRFVTAQAGMISTGAWDAKSLFEAAQGTVVTEDNPLRPGETAVDFRGKPHKNHRFGVKIMDFPMPGPNERWHDYITYPASDAQANGSGQYMISQRSPNKEWALDFLQFLTSYTVNVEFNRTAEWLPIVIGGQPKPELSPFIPKPEGFSTGDRAYPQDGQAGNLRTRYIGQFKNFLSGDIDYDEFVRLIREAAMDDRTGAERVLFDVWQQQRDQVRSVEALIAVQSARELLQDQPDASLKIIQGSRQSAMLMNATRLRHYWHMEFPDEPFPEY